MSWPFGFFTSIGEAEKSKSGPSVAGQFGLSAGLVGRHPPVQTSLASGCCDHRSLPVFMSNASTASVVSCAGSA